MASHHDVKVHSLALFRKKLTLDELASPANHLALKNPNVVVWGRHLSVMADVDADTIETADEDEEFMLRIARPPPLIIKGVGNMTLFGLTNRFDNDFPPNLLGKVAKEEFLATINGVNSLIGRAVPKSARWLVAGCLCCCCTAGLSLTPVVYLNKKTQSRIRGLLDHENSRVYQKLGYSWWLGKQKCTTNNLKEYVILIETLERVDVHRPD